MNVKDIIELDIESNGMDGEGVSRYDGRVVFVPFTLKGERVRAVVKTVKSRYAVASVIKVLSPSEYRVQPDCPHYFRCGGCDMRHITADYRREILLADLKNNLKKIAGVDLAPTVFVSCGDTRNKVAMPFGLKDGHVTVGMYRHGSHELEPVDCAMLGELGRQAVSAVVDFSDKAKLTPYNEKTGRGLLRHLVIREVGARASVTLVVNGELGGDTESALAARLPDGVDFFISKNTRRNNVILGSDARLVSGRPVLEVEVLGVRAELSPLSFFQVNDGIRDRLYSAAIGEISSPTLIDLYSGIGITSALAAQKCESVFAVEVVPDAVKNADRTAEINGLSDKIHNFCGDVKTVLPDILKRMSGSVDVLVDPPRKGCGAEVMNAISAASPDKIIYISCDHATMCRDIAPLISPSGGYKLIKAELYDMFPHTHHSETLVVLSKINPTSHINVEVEFGEAKDNFHLTK